MKSHLNCVGRKATPEHRAWTGMKKRCSYSRYPDFYRYGGRGISVCERWESSFENFLADMGARPSPKHSLDRINNDGNYEPSNCRWATKKEQANNRKPRRTEPNSIATKARQAGINYRTLLMRLSSGWEPSEALSEPLAKRKKRIDIYPPGPIPKEQLLEALREFYRLNGRLAHHRDLGRGKMPGSATYLRYFDSIHTAYTEAGLGSVAKMQIRAQAQENL